MKKKMPEKKKPTLKKNPEHDKMKKPAPMDSGKAKMAAKERTMGKDKKPMPKKASAIEKADFKKAVEKKSKDSNRKSRNKGR